MEDFASVGFLSDELLQLRQLVERNHARDIALFRELNAVCWEFQYRVEGSRDDWYLITTYARVLASVQAAGLLLLRGMPTQARMVLRPALELVFAIGAVHSKPHLKTRLMQDIQARRADMIRAIESEKFEPAEPLSPEAMRALDELRDHQKSTISTWSLAHAADLLPWYTIVYKRLSWTAHPAMEENLEHVELNGDELTTYLNEPAGAQQEFEWMIASNLFLLAADRVEQAFPCPKTRAKLDQLNASFAALYGKDHPQESPDDERSH